MKPVVMRSIEDETGARCVDLLRWRDGTWGFVECRRDPEDAHGWRRLADPETGFASEERAHLAARNSVGWLE